MPLKDPSQRRESLQYLNRVKFSSRPREETMRAAWHFSGDHGGDWDAEMCAGQRPQGAHE